MASTRQLSALRDDIRDRAGVRNSLVYTDVLLTRWVNVGLAKLQGLLVLADKYYFAKFGTLATVAGDAAVAAPADFAKLHAVQRLDGSRHRRVTAMGVPQMLEWQNRSGIPEHYALIASELQLAPVPDAVYTLRLFYSPPFTALAADDDEFDFVNGWEEYVVLWCLAAIREREDQPTAQLRQELDIEGQRIRAEAAVRDPGAPPLLENLQDPPLAYAVGDGEAGDGWA